MVTALTRKLGRDLLRMREQAVAIALVMACGTATFIMSLSMLGSLQGALDAYYERNRFAHVFANARRAPVSLKARVEAVPGVKRADCRIVESAILDIPDMMEPASARIISLPARASAGLNRVHLRMGRLPEGRDGREVVVSERFAEAHALLPGDQVTAVLNGRREQLRIVGVALSPEFIYLIPPGGLLPQDKSFAVFWMGREEMEAAFDMEGAFNDLLVSVVPNSDENEVIDRVDRLLDRYGGLGAYGREDQPSHQFIANEIKELRGSTIIVPSIFLGVAAFLLNLVIGRLVAQQREQIATLRALGYGVVAIGRHYLCFSLVISVAASAMGLILGIWMGRGLTAMYANFFDFPSFEFIVPMRVLIAGLLIGPLAGTVAVIGSLVRAMRLPPAEAMRPPAPTSYRPTIVERLGVHTMMPVWLRMVVRYLERRPLKTALSVLGVAMATAILVIGRYSEDAMHHIKDFQFNRVQQRDVDIALADETSDDAWRNARELPGVVAVEPYRGVAVRLVNGASSRRTGILGLADDDGMHRLLSMYGEQVRLPDSGVVLSSTLADLLGVRVGDVVTMEVLEGRRPTVGVRVAALIDDFSGLAAYMRLEALNRVMREAYTVSGVYVRMDPAQLEAFYAEIKGTPRVAGVGIKAAAVESFEKTLEENLGLMRTFLIAFSTIIAVGVVYNSARVSLSERSRDLGTLRVIGFSKSEVAAMQLTELGIVIVIGIPVGLLLGYWMAGLVAEASASELFRLPFVIYGSTFVFAAVITLIAGVVSGFAIDRRVRRMDHLVVLKSPE